MSRLQSTVLMMTILVILGFALTAASSISSGPDLEAKPTLATDAQIPIESRRLAKRQLGGLLEGFGILLRGFLESLGILELIQILFDL